MYGMYYIPTYQLEIRAGYIYADDDRHVTL